MTGIEIFLLSSLTFSLGVVVTAFGYTYSFKTDLTSLKGSVKSLGSQIQELKDGKINVTCPQHTGLSDQIKHLQDQWDREREKRAT